LCPFLIQMEENLKKNERQPEKNGRRPQKKMMLKDLIKMKDELKTNKKSSRGKPFLGLAQLSKI
jgi:hypothetical protein